MDDERDKWARRIEAASDLAELAQIDSGLADLGTEWAGPLRFRLGARRLALKRGLDVAASPQQVMQAVAPRVDRAFASAFGLPAPDGRRLHGYRLSGAAFEALQRELARCASFQALTSGHKPGLFVLWASEWFRRSWRGGMRRWEDLAAALGLPAPGQVEQHILRDVTGKGLSQWRRTVFFTGHSHYLATLAREGGFPAHAVADGAKGWASQALASVVGPLMGSPAAGEAEALELARAQKSRLPQVFSDDEFAQLCADLALAIVQIRRDAEPLARASGLPLTAWLALHRPGWREALPISTTDAAADALVEMLMQVEAVTGALVGVERMLLRDGSGAWREAVRMTLDGALSGGAMASVDKEYGRLRAFAAGVLARYVPGELALLDPPVDGDKEWTSRSARSSRGVIPLPFAAAVQLDLRAGERVVARIELPRGKPRRGQLLVLSLEEGTVEAPRCLRVVGSGSGRYRADQVYVQAPADWRVEAETGGSVVDLGAGAAESGSATALWHVSGGARLIDGFGDRYRVLCGQPSDLTLRLDILGASVDWAEVAGSVDLYLGPPLVSRNRAGEVVWRVAGSRAWRPAPGTLPVGQYELGWRQDGEMLDRRRIAVLPASASLVRSTGASGTSFEFKGFAPASIEPIAEAPVVASSGGHRWVPRAGAAPVRRFEANITWPDASPLRVGIAYPGEASITRWDGGILPHRSVLTLADFRDLVGRDDGQMQLLAELRDPHSRERAEMSWSFKEELPLSAIAGDVASLLLPAGLDAEVVLDMNNAINTNWHVRQFPLTLEVEGEGFVASSAILDDGVELCGRAIADPLEERCFGPYSLLSEANHRPASLSDGLKSDWLVFLRHGDRVLTRPKYFRGSGGAVPQGLLGAAMAQPHGAALDAALTSLIEAAATSEASGKQALDELLTLATTLHGLPPVTFRALDLLPRHPETLALMAIMASESQRDGVMALAESLPFAWYLLPRRSWDAARGALFVTIQRQLVDLGDKAAEYALRSVELATKALVEREAMLAPIFGPTPEPEPIGDIAMRFLQRGAIDRVRGASWGRYREIPELELPTRFRDFNPCVLDALDAPCAAAQAVLRMWTPTPAHVRHIKLTARSFPTWFSEAFAASLAGA